MGRNKKNNEEKKQSVSIALKPELLEYYRGLHINLSSLVNKLLEDYKKIIIVLQNMKLDDCKNYCPQLEKKTGGIKHKTLKSKIDLKKGKRN